MTKLKHTAHIKVPHHPNYQKMGVRTSEHLVAIVVMPKYRRGPQLGTKEWKAWNKLPVTIERESRKVFHLVKPKKGEKRGFNLVFDTDGAMLARANEVMMKYDVDSTWLMFKRKKKVHQLYKTL